MIFRIVEKLLLIGALAALIPNFGCYGQLRFLFEINSSFSNLYFVALVLLTLSEIAAGHRGKFAFSGALAILHGLTLAPAPDTFFHSIPKIAPGKSLRVFYANVWIRNPHPEDVAQAIQERNPDVVALTEVNERWLQTLSLEKTYPYSFLRPGLSADGGAIYSKYPLIELERFPDGVYFAALHATVHTDKEGDVSLYFIHAAPPHVDPALTDRDSLIEEIAKRVVGEGRRNVAVFGDFNTAFSSPSLRRYEQQLGLRNAFRSKWFHSSWHIREFPLVRTKIDQLFIGTGLDAHSLSIEPDVGSDHYPVYFELTPRNE